MAQDTAEVGPASGPQVDLEVQTNGAQLTNGHAKPSASPQHEEYQYLNLIRDILAEGEHRPDR